MSDFQTRTLHQHCCLEDRPVPEYGTMTWSCEATLPEDHNNALPDLREDSEAATWISYATCCIGSEERIFQLK